MARDTDGLEIPIPLRLYRSELTPRSLTTTPFKVDEGYSDDTRSQADKELSRTPSDDVMSIPEWVLAHNEAERAGKSPLAPSRVPPVRLVLNHQHSLTGHSCLLRDRVQPSTYITHFDRRFSGGAINPAVAHGPRSQAPAGNHL